MTDSLSFLYAGPCVLVPPGGTFTPNYPPSSFKYTVPTYTAVDQAHTTLQPCGAAARL